jgi:hypothetical protein
MENYMKDFRHYIAEQIDYDAKYGENWKTAQTFLKDTESTKKLVDAIAAGKEPPKMGEKTRNRTLSAIYIAYKIATDKRYKKLGPKAKELLDKVDLDVDTIKDLDSHPVIDKAKEIYRNKGEAPKEEEPETEEEEKPSDEEPEGTGEEDQETEEEPENDQQQDKEEEPEQKDTEEKETETKKKEKPSTDKVDYGDIRSKIQSQKEEAINKLKELEQKADSKNKKAITKQREDLEKQFNKLLKRVERAKQGLIMNPELKAKNALTDAKKHAETAQLKAKKAQQPGALKREVGELKSGAKYAAGRIKQTGEKIGQSAFYKQAKEAGRVGAKMAGAAGKAVGKQAKDIYQQVQNNARANFIAQQLDYRSARKWITSDDPKEKEKIYQQAMKKSRQTQQKKSAVAGAKTSAMRKAGQKQGTASPTKTQQTQKKVQQGIKKASEKLTPQKKKEIKGQGGGSPIKKKGA